MSAGCVNCLSNLLCVPPLPLMFYYSLTWDSWALADVHLSKRRPRAGDPCVFVVV